jgi:hypothetical protein
MTTTTIQVSFEVDDTLSPEVLVDLLKECFIELDQLSYQQLINVIHKVEDPSYHE